MVFLRSAGSVGRSASEERVAEATRAKQIVATQLVLWRRTRLDDTTPSAAVEDACLRRRRTVVRCRGEEFAESSHFCHTAVTIAF